jgi:hypothetical protein
MDTAGPNQKKRFFSCISLLLSRAKIQTSITGLTKTLSNSDAVPFVSIASLKEKPLDVDAECFPGLVHVHVVSSQSENHTIISYWKTRDHFQMCGSQLYEHLGASKILEGLAGLACKPAKPWHQYITPGPLYSLLITIVAFIAALLALRTNYALVFGTPMVEWQALNKEENYLKDEPFTIDGKILNIGDSNVKINHIKMRVYPGTGIVVAPDMPRIAETTPNQASDVHLTIRGSKTGIYDIVYSGRISNGFPGGHKTWEGFDIKVHIWRDCEAIKSPRFRPIDSKQCIIEGTLNVGRTAEKGIEVGALLIGHPEVSFANAGCPGNTAEVAHTVNGPNQESAKRTTKILWRTSRVSQFTSIPFVVDIVCQRPLNDVEWKKIADAVEMDTKY